MCWEKVLSLHRLPLHLLYVILLRWPPTNNVVVTGVTVWLKESSVVLVVFQIFLGQIYTWNKFDPIPRKSSGELFYIFFATSHVWNQSHVQTWHLKCSSSCLLISSNLLCLDFFYPFWHHLSRVSVSVFKVEASNLSPMFPCLPGWGRRWHGTPHVVCEVWEMHAWGTLRGLV